MLRRAYHGRVNKQSKGRVITAATATSSLALMAGRAGHCQLTIEQACERYHLSIDEYRAWERDFDSHGEAGLRSTRVGIYRRTDKQRSE